MELIDSRHYPGWVLANYPPMPMVLSDVEIFSSHETLSAHNLAGITKRAFLCGITKCSFSHNILGLFCVYVPIFNQQFWIIQQYLIQ